MTRPSRSALIVSDSAALRRYIASTLEGARFSCVEAANGFQAIDCLSERLFDLYLIDLDMQQSGGAAILAATLKRGFRDPSPTLIGISDRPKEQALKPPWGDASSFAALLAKPFRPGDLVAVVQANLARSPSDIHDPSDF
jgi:CheY-like chemotaxis protein